MVDSNRETGQSKPLWQRLIYLLLVFVTGVICVYDTVLSICFAPSLPYQELNPLCNLIIKNGGVRQLIIIKSIGTIAGISMLMGLAYTRFRVCVAIMFFLGLFLFFYLTFYCPSGDYSMSALMQEGTSPVIHFIKFYRAVDSLTEGNL